MSRMLRIAGSLAAALVLIAAAGFFTRGLWWPGVRSRLLVALGAASLSEAASGAQGGHDDHAGHDESNSIHLSEQARANIKLKTGKVELTTFPRKITIPGIVRERPGRSTVEITAPFTGIVTRIDAIEGEAVAMGRHIFDLRLTHEDLVRAQADFLQAYEELQVIGDDIRRIEKIAAEGGIAGKQMVELKHDERVKQAVYHARYQSLLLHNLTDEQVKQIQASRTLLQSVAIYVPDEPASGERGNKTPPDYQVQELRVARGQSVAAGQTLAVLADHAELYIEGNAFDRDMTAVARALENNWEVDAAFETDEARPQIVRGLKILYDAGRVDPEARTFPFYLTLPNERLPGASKPGEPRFVRWRYKPGSRVQLTVPVEHWERRIVLPIEAVAQEGVETYVFLPSADHFDRRPVHVEYRDRYSAVIANDGSLYEGDEVVLAGAQQMQLALKNKSGGGVDPHAGHSH